MQKASLRGAGRILARDPWHLDMHEHRVNQLIVVVQGRMQVDQPQGPRLIADPGTLLIYPAGCPHEETSLEGDLLHTFFFSFSGACPPPIRRIEDIRHRVRTLAEMLYEDWSLNRSAEDPSIVRFFSLIMSELHILESRKTHEDPILRARRYMVARLAEPLTLDAIAREAGMSRYHFCRTFKQLTGLSPMKALKHLRIDSAKSLIASQQLPLRTVALQCGFADEFHFSREFKKICGVSPSAFRKQNQR